MASPVTATVETRSVVPLQSCVTLVAEASATNTEEEGHDARQTGHEQNLPVAREL